MFGRNQGLSALLERPRRSKWQLFLKEPCLFLAGYLYGCRPVIPFTPINPITVVCVSDTHNSQPKIPPGDVLIHAGDLTQGGNIKELQVALDWLHSLPHRHKVIIGGNHETILDENFKQRGVDSHHVEVMWKDLIYLENDTTEISCANGRRIKIHGSPLTPKHGNWAFQYPRTQDVWQNQIPSDLDILITHGPPKGHLDSDGLGCTFLLKELWRSKPRLHVFGHVHSGYGKEWVQFDTLQESFEAVRIAGGGLFNLARMVVQFFLARFVAPKESRALLVNAAQVGGLRDEIRREPIVVQI